MVRSPSIDKNGMKKGAWSEDEDRKLKAYVERYGHWNWRQIPKFAGLSRCGKSCRLRWLNYLKPDVKRGSYTKEEEDTILKLHDQLGKKWSVIAKELPGRTDNEIKNYWHTHLKKRSEKTENSILSSYKEMKKQSEKTKNSILSSNKEMEESSNTCTSDQGSHENSSLIFEEMNQESSQYLPIPVHQQSSMCPEQSSCSKELSSGYFDAPLSDLTTWTGEESISSFEYSLGNLWSSPFQTGYDDEEINAAYDSQAPLVDSGLLNQLSSIFGDDFLWSYDLGHGSPIW